jgi:hypothetical protein
MLGRCSRRPEPSLLATAVPHKVGHGHWRRCIEVFQAFSDMLQAYVLSVSVVSNVCFKCFILILQK